MFRNVAASRSEAAQAHNHAFEWKDVTPVKTLSLKGTQSFSNVHIQTAAEGTEDILKDDRACRRCSIDLLPKLIWSRSVVIDTLIRAGVSRYMEFKTIQHLYVQVQGQNLVQVPVSKADVFRTADLSLIEKRQLMKFVTTISQPDEEEQAIIAEYAAQPIIEYMRKKKLTENLILFLLYAVALEPHLQTSPMVMNTADGLSAIGRFMSSVGRYGANTPWIYPLFGVSDLCQSFSRLSAVYGTTFLLDKHVTEVTTSRNEGGVLITGVNIGTTTGIKTKHVISNLDHLPELADPASLTTPAKTLSRCVLLTNRHLHTREGANEILMLVIPPGTHENAHAIYVLQLDESASVAPAGKVLLQFWTEGTGNGPQADLQRAVESLVDPLGATAEATESSGRPSVCYSAYFSQVERRVRSDVHLPTNLTLVNQVNFDLGTDAFFAEAEAIFHRIVPDEEFIPVVPNPEDIIWVRTCPMGHPTMIFSTPTCSLFLTLCCTFCGEHRAEKKKLPLLLMRIKWSLNDRLLNISVAT